MTDLSTILFKDMIGEVHSPMCTINPNHPYFDYLMDLNDMNNIDINNNDTNDNDTYIMLEYECLKWIAEKQRVPECSLHNAYYWNPEHGKAYIAGEYKYCSIIPTIIRKVYIGTADKVEVYKQLIKYWSKLPFDVRRLWWEWKPKNQG